jgi:TadE-like protein
MTVHPPGIAASLPGRRGPAPSDRGSVSAELVVFVVPVMILLTMFVVFCGRSASAAIDVHSAAAAAARAAADAATPASAVTAAASAVAATSAGTAWACTPSVDTGQLRAGGQVSVSVDCRVPLADLGLPGLTAARVVRASATEPIDTYRARP